MSKVPPNVPERGDDPISGTMHVYDASVDPETKIGEFPIVNGRVRFGPPVSRRIYPARLERRDEGEKYAHIEYGHDFIKNENGDLVGNFYTKGKK